MINDREVYDFEEQTRSTRFERFFLNSKIVYLAVFFVGLAGLLIQVLWGNSWFARSGALITLFAIGMVWAVLQIQAKLLQVEAFMESEASVTFGGTTQVLKQAKWLRIFGYATVHFDGDEKALNQRATQLITELGGKSDVAMKKQFGLAGLGTLIWAFGDLVPGGILC